MPSEQQILKVIRSLTPNSKKYLFDDAALIEKNLVVTTDSLIENTHFTLKTYTPEEIGWKAMAINLSDIAAMGAKPLYALVSFSLPKVKAGLKPASTKWIKHLYKGILACAKKYKTQIIGGNLARGNEINITITIIGKTIVKMLHQGISTGKRSNAKPGDLIFTTGDLGNSACGLLLINRCMTKHVPALVSAHKKPIPQINLGQIIVSACSKHAPALMDTSDGLADCLCQIATQSKVKLIVEEDKIPVSQTFKKAMKLLKINPLKLTLYGGEDYQLVGTVSKNDCKKIKNLRIIGKVVKGKGAFLKQKNNKLVKLDLNKAFSHFI